MGRGGSKTGVFRKRITGDEIWISRVGRSISASLHPKYSISNPKIQDLPYIYPRISPVFYEFTLLKGLAGKYYFCEGGGLKIQREVIDKKDVHGKAGRQKKRRKRTTSSPASDAAAG